MQYNDTRYDDVITPYGRHNTHPQLHSPDKKNNNSVSGVNINSNNFVNRILANECAWRLGNCSILLFLVCFISLFPNKGLLIFSVYV